MKREQQKGNYWTDERRKQAIADMRELCDFLEANPEFTMPSNFSGPVWVQNWGEVDSEDVKAVRAWFLKNAKMLGPNVRATYDDSQFVLMRDFGELTVCLMNHRVNLCDARIETVEVTPPPVVTERVILECPDSIKALGFSDPGAIKVDGYEERIIKQMNRKSLREGEQLIVEVPRHVAIKRVKYKEVAPDVFDVELEYHIERENDVDFEGFRVEDEHGNYLADTFYGYIYIERFNNVPRGLVVERRFFAKRRGRWSLNFFQLITTLPLDNDD